MDPTAPRCSHIDVYLRTTTSKIIYFHYPLLLTSNIQETWPGLLRFTWRLMGRGRHDL